MEAVRSFFYKKITVGADSSINWLKTAPLKVSCFIWKAKLGRLPVVNMLAKREIQLPSTTFRLCDDGEKTIDHVFTRCSFARSAFEWILRLKNSLRM